MKYEYIHEGYAAKNETAKNKDLVSEKRRRIKERNYFLTWWRVAIFVDQIIFFFRFTAHLGLGFYNLFVQYYSVICRPSDHTVGRPPAENRTQDGQSRRKDSNP